MNDLNNIKLKKVKTEEEINVFVNFKIELVKYHEQFASIIGLEDDVVKNYDRKDAMKTIGKSNYYQFLIEYNNKDIGLLEYQMKKSKIDNQKILYIKKLFISDKYRGKGIGKAIMNELKKKKYRIELECWYNMPSNEFYKSLGMKEIKTCYMLDVK